MDVLKILPAASVDCVVTSPPYWGLRAYKTEPQIWDGNADCEHLWIDHAYARRGNDQNPGGKQKTDSGSVGRDVPIESAFCSRCGAWHGELGLEPTFELFVEHLCDVFAEVKRVLRKTGTCFVNLGDTYWGAKGTCFNPGGGAGSLETARQEVYPLKRGNRRDIPWLQPKSLCMVPSRFAIEMCNRGWILRNEIIWCKSNCMPSSVKDRFTVDFEKLLFFTKSRRYYFEPQYECHQGRPSGNKRRKVFAGLDRGRLNTHMGESIPWTPASVGRNKRCVWRISTKPFPGAHFAVFPPELVETPIKAGCPEFVCNACGTPREKVYKKEFVDVDAGRYEGKYKGGDIGQRKQGFVRNNSMAKQRKFSREIARQMFPNDVKSQRALMSHVHDHGGTLTKFHFAGYSACSCRAGFSPGIVLDPFLGSGTTALVALRNHRRFIGIELNPEYIEIAKERIKPYLRRERLSVGDVW